jgi:hypothetical protein
VKSEASSFSGKLELQYKQGDIASLCLRKNIPAGGMKDNNNHDPVLFIRDFEGCTRLANKG